MRRTSYKLLFSLLCGFLIFAATSSVALAEASSSTNTANSSKTRAPAPLTAETDRWYWLLSAGLVPQPQHDSGTNSEIKTSKDNMGFAGEYGAILEPGVYHLLGKASLIGLSSTLIFENYARNFAEKNSLSFSTYSLNLSAISFTGAQPGLGYYARLDLGASQLIEATEAGGVMSRNYYSGMLSQLGFGYGFQFSEGCRMLVDLRAAYEAAADRHYLTAVSFNMGVLL